MNEMNILTLNGEQYEIADQKAREGKADKAYTDKTFAPAIPVTMIGTAVSTDMVSPVEHEVKCKVSGVDDLTAVTVSRYGENLVKKPYADNSKTENGVTFTVLPNGAVKVTGTATKSAYFSFNKSDTVLLETGYPCIMRGTPNAGKVIQMAYARENGEPVVDAGKGVTIPQKTKIAEFYIYVRGGTVCSGETVYPLVSRFSEQEQYTPDSAGTVTGMKSISPSMTITTDNPGANLEVTYNADTKKYIDSKSGGKQSGITLTANVDTGSEVTVTDGTDTLTETSADGKAKFLLPHGGKWDVSAKKDGAESNKETVDVADNYAVSLSYVTIDKVLNNNSWADIHAASASGEAQNYWSIGDAKQITINGQVGKTTFSNLAIDVFIIGFNHNAELEGNNLTHFQIGKIGGKDVALCDSEYGKKIGADGYFNWNTSDTNVGGWEMSYRRNKLYGDSGTPGSPLPGSFMAALPDDLRKAIQPVEKYTDNFGEGYSSLKLVTATTDYLWDLAEYEVNGEFLWANSYERNKQKQYSYYSAGNPRVAYKHTNLSSPAKWGLRSLYGSNKAGFCYTDTDNKFYYDLATLCTGIRPGFAV